MTPPPPRLILHGAGSTVLSEPLANPGVEIEVAWLSLLHEHCPPLVCCGCGQWWKGGGGQKGVYGADTYGCELELTWRSPLSLRDGSLPVVEEDWLVSSPLEFPEPEDGPDKGLESLAGSW